MVESIPKVVIVLGQGTVMEGLVIKCWHGVRHLSWCSWPDIISWLNDEERASSVAYSKLKNNGERIMQFIIFVYISSFHYHFLRGENPYEAKLRSTFDGSKSEIARRECILSVAMFTDKSAFDTSIYPSTALISDDPILWYNWISSLLIGTSFVPSINALNSVF